MVADVGTKERPVPADRNLGLNSDTKRTIEEVRRWESEESAMGDRNVKRGHKGSVIARSAVLYGTLGFAAHILLLGHKPQNGVAGVAAVLAVLSLPAWAPRVPLLSGSQQARQSTQEALGGVIRRLPVALLVLWLASGKDAAGLVIAASAGIAYLVKKHLEEDARASAEVGDVYWVRVPNDDPDAAESHKIRPGLVISVEAGVFGVLWATSLTKRLGERGYLDVTDLPGWPADPTGDKRSILNLRSPHAAVAEDFHDHLGGLAPAQLALVATAYRNANSVA